MIRTIAEIGAEHYSVTIDANGYALKSDEPPSRGGGGLGPGPYDLLLASLGSCTAITLRMYADRKQWGLKSLRVDLVYTRAGGKEHVDRTLYLEGDLNDEQRARFVEIADRTPVTLTLKGSLSVTTMLGAAPSGSAA